MVTMNPGEQSYRHIDKDLDRVTVSFTPSTTTPSGITIEYLPFKDSEGSEAYSSAELTVDSANNQITFNDLSQYSG